MSASTMSTASLRYVVGVVGSDRQMPNEKLAHRDLVLQHMDWTKSPDEFAQ